MPTTNFVSSFDSSLDKMTLKIEQLRQRSSQRSTLAVDDAMDASMALIESNKGKKEAQQAQNSLLGFSSELRAEGQGLHQLSAARVADLIADPFEE